MSLNSGYDLSDSRQETLQEISFINKVYGIMTLGLFITALTSYQTYMNMDPRTLNGILFPCLIAELILVWILSAAINKLPTIAALLGFAGYSVLNGITLSSIFYVYQIGSVYNVFVSTSCTFGIMALYGTVTRKDLTSLGHLCIMGVLGIIIASIVNMFLKSQGMDTVISALGVLLFVGITAYDTQKIKRLNDAGCNHTGIAVLGALSLYLDFINIFLYLLRLFGKRK